MKLEDIEVGQRLPVRVHTPTRAQLVRYAGAARDFSPVHFDESYARTRGFPDVIVHGFLKAGFLAELARAWAGETSWFRSFEATYRGFDIAGAPIICRGTVTDVDVPLLRLHLELWTENTSGTRTTTAAGVLQVGEQ